MRIGNTVGRILDAGLKTGPLASPKLFSRPERNARPVFDILKGEEVGPEVIGVALEVLGTVSRMTGTAFEVREDGSGRSMWRLEVL